MPTREDLFLRRGWMRTGLWIAAAVFALAPAFALAAKPAANAATNPDCSAAKATYTDKCSMCHGDDGKGYPALNTPDFTDPQWQAAHTDAELAAMIRDGKTGTSMPAFKDQLKPAEIDALVTCVVRGFGKPSKPAASGANPHSPQP